MKKLVVFLSIVVGLFVVLIVLAYLNLNTIVEQGIKKIGPKITKTSVNLTRAKISLFSGQGELYNFAVGNPKGFTSPYLFKVKKLDIALKPMSLFKDTIVIDKIYIDSPYIAYEYRKNKNNLTVFQKNIQGETQPKAHMKTRPQNTAKKQKHIFIKELIIKNAQVEVLLPELGIKKKQVVVKEIRLKNLGGKGKSTKQIIAEITKAILDKVIPGVSPVLGQLKSGLKDVQSKLKGNLQELKQGTLDQEKVKSQVKGLKEQFKGLLPKK